MGREQELIAALERLGRASGPDLARVLGVSPATLSRAVRSAGDAVCRMGRRRGARYALRRRVGDLPLRIPVFRVEESRGQRPRNQGVRDLEIKGSET